MWAPTHVKVTVQRAIGLLTKGKNNTNDCFVTIGLGKVKYQTSVKVKAESSVEWHEECELPIPDQGNTAEIVFTALHHNFVGVDEFLGRVTIPLNSLDIYERPKNKLYPLQAKPGKKTKDRGQLEIKIEFNVKSGSLTNLSKKDKHKLSLSHVAQTVGGSLLSIGSAEKRKGIKKFAKSIGAHIKGKKHDGEDYGSSSIGSVDSLSVRNHTLNVNFRNKQTAVDADPGVISDEDEFTFDNLSHQSSNSSLYATTSLTNTTRSLPRSATKDSISLSPSIPINKSRLSPPVKPPRSELKVQDEWQFKLFGNAKLKNAAPESNESLNKSISEENEFIKGEKVIPGEPLRKEKEGMYGKIKNIINKDDSLVKNDENQNTQGTGHIVFNNELLQRFEGKSREELILALVDVQNDLDKHKRKLKDLEDYLDDLLLRVMETTPKILQNPYVTYQISHKQYL